jgi:hypothetical protein
MKGRLDLLLALQTEGQGNLNRNPVVVRIGHYARNKVYSEITVVFSLSIR